VCKDGDLCIVRIVTHAYSFCDSEPSFVEDGFFLDNSFYELAHR